MTAPENPETKLNPAISASTGSPAADYVWTGWGRRGRCLPIDGERIAEYECAFCERPITRDMDPDAPCPGKPKGAERLP